MPSPAMMVSNPRPPSSVFFRGPESWIQSFALADDGVIAAYVTKGVPLPPSPDDDVIACVAGNRVVAVSR